MKETLLSSRDPTLHTDYISSALLTRKEAIPKGWFSCTSLGILCDSYPACLTFPNPVR